MASPALPNETVELVDHVVAFQGYFRVGRYFFRHGLYEGGQSRILQREVFERGQAAAVLPYDPLRDEVVLIRQFRAGAYVAGRHPWTWEIVAGIIEADESPEDLIRREAVEEAALEIRDVIPMHNVVLSPGACSEACVTFLGRVDTTGAGGVFGLEVGRREHPGQGPALRRSAFDAGARRDRQRHRRDRPAMAGPASRRGAEALGLTGCLDACSLSTVRRGSAGPTERARHGRPVGFHR